MEANENQGDEISKKTQEKIDKNVSEFLEEERLKKLWKKEVDESAAAQKFFEDYKPSSIDYFVTIFLNHKYYANKNEDYYSKAMDEKRDKWINEAHEHLKIILCKKLFDLQCKWRAGQIELEGIEICYDFRIWADGIFNCPCIDLITDEEIEMYQKYLLESENDESFDEFESQDYENIKAFYIDDDDDELDFEMPEWYEYHNIRTGNGQLLILPDIKGEKEEFYMGLPREETKNKMEQKAKTNEPKDLTEDDNRPYLFYNEDDMERFVAVFESKENIRKYQNYLQISPSNKRDSLNFDHLMYQMDEQDELIPIYAHPDYREGLRISYHKFCCKKIAAHLPIAHEQYLFNKKMGFAIEEDRKVDQHQVIKNIYLKSILKGRELNGEPRDLNF